jgi:ribosomal protein S27AE
VTDNTDMSRLTATTPTCPRCSTSHVVALREVDSTLDWFQCGECGYVWAAPPAPRNSGEVLKARAKSWWDDLIATWSDPPSGE